jgi:energy-coupling factor transporter transmembrane protein EcfT
VTLQFLLERIGWLHAFVHGTLIAVTMAMRSPASWEQAVIVLWALVEPPRLLAGIAGNLRESPVVVACCALATALLTLPITASLLTSNPPGMTLEALPIIEGSTYAIAVAVYLIQFIACCNTIFKLLPSPTTSSPQSSPELELRRAKIASNTQR